jgi:hypothetical protein
MSNTKKDTIVTAKVTININGNKIGLTWKEAKELKLALEELFPSKDTIPLPHPLSPWRTFPIEPYYTAPSICSTSDPIERPYRSNDGASLQTQFPSINKLGEDSGVCVYSIQLSTDDL